MIKFKEFVDEMDANGSTDQMELLKRIVHGNGGRFRVLLKQIISDGLVDDDPELSRDIKELSNSMRAANQDDQFPVRDNKPRGELDVVARPKSDGGVGPSGNDGEEN